MSVIRFQEGSKAERVMRPRYCFKPLIKAILHVTNGKRDKSCLMYFHISGLLCVTITLGTNIV
jgi:hypothetical protein